MNIVLQILIYVCIFTTAYLIICSESRKDKQRLRELRKIKKGADERQRKDKM